MKTLVRWVMRLLFHRTDPTRTEILIEREFWGDDDDAGAGVAAMVPPRRPAPVASNVRRLEEAEQ